jgi:hypothetical protein
MRIGRYVVLAVRLPLVVAALESAPASAQVDDTLVSVGSPLSPFSRNKQNEPAVAAVPSIQRPVPNRDARRLSATPTSSARRCRPELNRNEERQRWANQ